MMIYLDNAATAKLREVDNIIIESMTNAMKTLWMNPSSLYASNVKDEIDRCRANIAKFIGAKPEEIIFTSGASESNNLAIQGFAENVWSKSHKNLNVITTRLEHKSIMNLVQDEYFMGNVRYCSVDEFGLIDLNHLETLLKHRLNDELLVSICMANNEIGTCQHIKVISDLVHKYNGILHMDATQAFSHIPINVKELGIDMMSVSGHKISPVLRGIGFLYKKESGEIKPIIYGTQENGLRGGTTNTYGIIGLSKAIDCCDVSYEKIEELIDKRDYFINQLETKFGCKLNGHPDYRLPNNINIILPDGISGESVLYMLELSNIYISTSSACNSYSITPSHVLKAIGLTDEEAMRTVRFTLPDDIGYEEIDEVIKEIDKAIKIIQL